MATRKPVRDISLANAYSFCGLLLIPTLRLQQCRQALCECAHKKNSEVLILLLTPVKLSYIYSVMFTREHAKRKLKELGIPYRKAAPRCGVTYQHLSEVLNGHRASRRLLLRIRGLTREEQQVQA